jgi:hypothetical protein
MLKATLQCDCNIHWPPSKREDYGSRRPSSNEMFQFTSQHLTVVNVHSFQQQELNLAALISLNIRHESMISVKYVTKACWDNYDMKKQAEKE